MVSVTSDREDEELMTMHSAEWTAYRFLAAAAILVFAASCVRTPPEVAPSVPPSAESAETGSASPRSAPPRAPAPSPDAPPRLPDDEFSSRTLEEINRASPLEPIFFRYDSVDLDADALAAIQSNVTTLEGYSSWSITIEGHCDSRGTPEYNLALGERRALTVRNRLVSLGIDPGRIRTISYGEEFPFSPGEHEAAWAANRRAHFVVTAR